MEIESYCGCHGPASTLVGTQFWAKCRETRRNIGSSCNLLSATFAVTKHIFFQPFLSRARETLFLFFPVNNWKLSFPAFRVREEKKTSLERKSFLLIFTTFCSIKGKFALGCRRCEQKNYTFNGFFKLLPTLPPPFPSF